MLTLESIKESMLPFEVVIIHDKAINAEIVLQTFDILQKASLQSIERQLEDRHGAPLPIEIYSLIRDWLENNRSNLVFIEVVAPGSSRFKGFIVTLVTAVLCVGGDIMKDELKETIKQTALYRDGKATLEKYAEDGVTILVEEANKLGKELKKLEFNPEIKDGKFCITVKPFMTEPGTCIENPFRELPSISPSDDTPSLNDLLKDDE